MSSNDTSNNSSGKKKKFYDGMEAVVEQKGKNSLCISTCYPSIRNLIKYEQVGIYHGNTDGIKEGAVIQVYFRKDQKWKEIFKEMGLIKGLKEISRMDNIEKVVLVKQGNIETIWQSYKEMFKF